MRGSERMISNKVMELNDGRMGHNMMGIMSMG